MMVAVWRVLTVCVCCRRIRCFGRRLQRQCRRNRRHRRQCCCCRRSRFLKINAPIPQSSASSPSFSPPLPVDEEQRRERDRVVAVRREHCGVYLHEAFRVSIQYKQMLMVSLAAPATPETRSSNVVVDEADFRFPKNAVHTFETHPSLGSGHGPGWVEVAGWERLHTTQIGEGCGHENRMRAVEATSE